MDEKAPERLPGAILCFKLVWTIGIGPGNPVSVPMKIDSSSKGLIKGLLEVGAEVEDRDRRWIVHPARAFSLAGYYRAVFEWGHTLKIAFDRANEGVVCSNPVKRGADLAKSWDWVRRTVLGTAMDPVRRLKSSGLEDLGRKPTAFL